MIYFLNFSPDMGPTARVKKTLKTFEKSGDLKPKQGVVSKMYEEPSVYLF